MYEEDGLIERAARTGALMADLLADLAARHPSVGAVRSIGLFGIVELVRNRATRAPMAPFNGTSPEMAALGKFFRDEGLFTFVRWNYFFTNPPLSITEAELREGFAIIDRGSRSPIAQLNTLGRFNHGFLSSERLSSGLSRRRETIEAKKPRWNAQLTGRDRPR